MTCNAKQHENNCEKLVDDPNVEDGEIFDIVELDGIEVWGQHQNVIEQEALSHLKSITANNETTTIATADDNQDKINKIKNTVLDINKYLQSQAQLKTNFEHKRNKLISSKSKDIAKKISDRHLNKNESDKINSLKRTKKIKNVIEQFNSSAEKNVIKEDIQKLECGSDSEYYPSEEYESDDNLCKPTTSTKRTGFKRKRISSENYNESEEKIKDDGLLSCYMNRMQEYYKNNEGLDTEEYVIQDKLKISKIIWEKLYSYQQDGIKWLWNIHRHESGGLLGDEMGLGKTVQVIVFLCALEYSKIKSYNGKYNGLGPSIIVCPATVIHQWVRHFHQWWPPFRVALLHQSGTYPGPKIQLINEINKNNGILVTTYESILKYKGVLAEKKWHYLILDEGHKIRNLNAKITVAVKQFRTPHKLILTGSPMQNHLQELWSLFDFIVPGKLGSHQAFMEYFATPIIQGGYTNASPTQETTAQLIATSLKDMINPFMLRRTKVEVQESIYLPSKSEQVLFCSLTTEQKDLYRGYLLSDHIGSILGRTKTVRVSENQAKANILVGITTLRKICNHPDLYLGEADEADNSSSNEIPIEKTFGYFKRSGKMIVVAALLKIWKRQGHRMLLFTQTRGMVDIFENFLSQQDYKYLKMDGATSISNRQFIIDKFNQDTLYDVFLLTTRVGGLGVNLTGADRVIIYDPDWNPATDTQARERAWRIGQDRQVTIYRLISAGTIEEKIYQRQVWKQLLSNKILIDPKTKRFFNTSDLSELFSLQEQSDANPETANIFRNSKVEINTTQKANNNSLNLDLNTDVIFSKEKLDEMKKKAQDIAKKMNCTQKVNNMVEKAKDEKIIRPSPSELRAINRKRLEVKEEPTINKINDCATNTSFSEALIVAEKCVTDYNKKIKFAHEVEEKTVKIIKKDKEKTKIDKSGEIDGEKIEGLVKTEVQKKEKSKKYYKSNQDDYVLEKLFSKKNVHTALQHDVIVQSGSKDTNNLKVHYEAKKKADIALNALRKSRINNWRW